MWNLISCNKLTQERIRQKSYDQHVNKIKKMKSKIKIQQPQQPWFVYLKTKKQLTRNDQLKQIEKHNTLLLTKINTIQNRDNKTFKNATFLTTLNSKIINDTNHLIYKQNQRICQKIMRTQAFYKTQNILQNTNNLEKVMNNISENSRRVQSAKFIASSKSKIVRPKSSLTKRPYSSYSMRQLKNPIYTQLKETQLTPQNSYKRSRALSAHPSNKKIRQFQVQPNNQQNQM